MTTMILDELVHYVQLAVPVAITDGTAVKSAYVSLKEYEAVDFVIQFGHITGDAAVVYLYEATSSTGGSATKRAGKYRLSSALGTDAMGAVTALVAATGVAIAATDDNKILVVSVDAASLTDGYPWVCVEYDGGASTSDVDWAVVAVLKPRYPQSVQMSAVD